MTRRTRTRNRRNRRKHTTRSTLERSLRKTIEASIRKSLKKLTNRKMKKKKRKTKRKKKLQRGGAGSEPVGGIAATTPATTNKDAAIANILTRHDTFKDTEYSASTLLKKVDGRSVGGFDAAEAASLSGNITPKDVIGVRRANGGQGVDDPATIRDFFERGMVSDDVPAQSLIFGKGDEGYLDFIRYVAVSTVAITDALVDLAQERQLAATPTVAAGVVAGPAGPPAPLEPPPEPVPSAGEPSGKTEDVLSGLEEMRSRVRAQQQAPAPVLVAGPEPEPAPVLAPAPVAVAVGGTTCDVINKDITLLGAKINALETEKEILERSLAGKGADKDEVDRLNGIIAQVQAELTECNRKKALLEQELAKLIKELYCSILAKVRISRLAYTVQYAGSQTDSAGRPVPKATVTPVHGGGLDEPLPDPLRVDIGLAGATSVVTYGVVLQALLSDQMVGGAAGALGEILSEGERRSIRAAEGLTVAGVPVADDEIIGLLKTHIYHAKTVADS